jgi:hypothetical protein
MQPDAGAVRLFVKCSFIYAKATINRFCAKSIKGVNGIYPVKVFIKMKQIPVAGPD